MIALVAPVYTTAYYHEIEKEGFKFNVTGSRLPPIATLIYSGALAENLGKYTYEEVYIDRVYACDNRQPDYRVLALRDIFTFDDVTEELISELALFGYDGFDYWTQACELLPEGNVWPAVMPDIPKKEVELIPCYTAIGSVEYLTELPGETDVGRSKQYEVCAARRKVDVYIDRSFTDRGETLCTNKGTLDYSALDSTLRVDRVAQNLRSDIGVFGVAVLLEAEEQCTKGRLLSYGNTCNGSPMYAQDTAFDMDLTSSDASFHFHFRSNTGTIVRGLEWYNNHVRTYGVRPCPDQTCQVVTGQSCHGFSRLVTYSCTSGRPVLVHVSGSFRGSIRFQGTIISQSGCGVRLDGLNVYLERSTEGWCDGYISLGVAGYSLADQTKRNGCSL